jgi:hypothetical protein
MSNVGRKLIGNAEDLRAIARRKILRQRLKLSRFLKGEAPSTEYDWGCDYPPMVRPDHNDTLFITFAERAQRKAD